MDSLKRGCVCRVGERKREKERIQRKESIHVRLTVKKDTNFNEEKKKTVSSSSSSVVATTREKD